MQKARGDFGHFFYRGFKYGFIRLGRLGESANLSNELQRSGVDFFFRDGRSEVKERFDVSTHKVKPYTVICRG
jgi:hypothetical protein